MKIGDVITVMGPHDNVVSGRVVHVATMKTRSGWNVTITITSEHVAMPGSYVIRPEDEGSAWIYGDDQKEKDALRVARALGDTTQVSPRSKLSKAMAGVRAKIRRKRGTP